MPRLKIVDQTSVSPSVAPAPGDPAGTGTDLAGTREPPAGSIGDETQWPDVGRGSVPARELWRERRVATSKTSRSGGSSLSAFDNPLIIILLSPAQCPRHRRCRELCHHRDHRHAQRRLDFVQEVRAQKAVEALRRSVAVQATVRRDGAAVSVPIDQLVPGDIVELIAGDLVPADSRLLESRDLYVNQALLTGEPYPAEKQASDAASGAENPAGASNAVFAGTSVISGTATILICRTGSRSALGHLATSLAEKPPATAFAVGIRRFSMLIMRFTVLMVLFVLVVNICFHRPMLESLMFAVALAVGLTPELLPMIVTVTLARSAMQMAKRKVIVKRLSAIHDLGAMNVLCTDKTGTLTEATIKLMRVIDGHGAESAPAFSYAYVNSQFETGMKSPLDEAILAARPFDMTGWQKIDEVPFDFERRRVSVLVEHDGKRRLIVKGAPEDMLRLSEPLRGRRWRCEAADAETRRTFEATLDGAWRARVSRPGHCHPRPGRRDTPIRQRRDHRRDRYGFRRLRGLPRSAESRARARRSGRWRSRASR